MMKTSVFCMSVEQAIALIKKQNLETEIRLLDDLFVDVRQKLEESEPPAWHKKILDARLSKETNDSDFSSWEEVKIRILNAPKN